MPQIQVSQADLTAWGSIWLGTQRSDKTDGTPNLKPKQMRCFDKKQGMNFGYVIDSPSFRIGAHGVMLDPTVGLGEVRPNTRTIRGSPS